MALPSSVLRLVRQAAGAYGIRGSAPLRRLSWLHCMRLGCRRRRLPNGLAGAKVPSGTVCGGSGEREQRKIAFWSGEELVEFGVRADGTDMDIGGVEASDRRQKPVLREVG
jgi:hypothetical protein